MADTIASSQCPICGLDSPHQHSDAEVRKWRETERWVGESLEQFHQNMADILSGTIKPSVNCGCEDMQGKPDPECVFCGHPGEPIVRDAS